MPTSNTKQIAFVVYPGLTPLDLIGPLQVLSSLPRIDPTFEVVVVAETRDVIPTDAIVGLAPSHTFEDAPSPYAIVVPGGAAHAGGAAATSGSSTTSPAPPPTPRSSCRSAPARSSSRPPRCSTTAQRRRTGPTSTSSNSSGRSRSANDGSKTASTSPPPASPPGSTAPSTSASRLVGEDAAKLIQRGLEYEPEPPFGPIDWNPDIVDCRPADLARTAPRGVSRPPVPGPRCAARRRMATGRDQT